MKRSWWHVVKHVLFGLHSPSLIFVGLCWCQRKQNPFDPYAYAEQQAAIVRASEAAWRGWGE
jgi:hypothetical protein